MKIEPAVNEWVLANTGFALDLLHRLGPADANLAFSPYSAAAALALVYEGARGRTAAELAQALGLPPSLCAPPDRSSPTLAAAVSGLRTRLGAVDQGSATLLLADALWYQSGLKLDGAYLAAARGPFGATIEPLDFRNDPAASAAAINAWVDRSTQHRITRLFESNAGGPHRSDAGGANRLKPETSLVIADAVYFRSHWASEFKPRNTRPAPFRLDPDTSSLTPMMRQTGRFQLLELPQASLLDLPYRDGLLSMTVILPKAVDGLAKLEAQMRTNDLLAWLAQLDFATEQEVSVMLPRFRIENGLDLVAPLRAMGVSAVFDRAASDLSGMIATPRLSVDKAYQKVWLDVDEQGTEAAAATGISVAGFAVHRSLSFHADHPFLFLIRERSTGSLLFLGRFAKPQ